jgi:hypothetical protein
MSSFFPFNLAKFEVFILKHKPNRSTLEMLASSFPENGDTGERTIFQSFTFPDLCKLSFSLSISCPGDLSRLPTTHR